MNYPVLITGTIAIMIFSWFLSIKYKRYHGIARFFSFESIFLLILFNYHIWFRNPFSLLQIISWILLILSLIIAVDGFYILKKRGKADGNFENTTVLIKSGVYGYIRHPLYLSLILLGFGIVLKDAGTKQLVFGLVNLAAIYLTARIEEKEMNSKFGNEYAEYIKKTWMFLPFIL
jgi:protein-S-isoprenylcysteine O-methyltransferase Ste14